VSKPAQQLNYNVANGLQRYIKQNIMKSSRCKRTPVQCH